MRTERNGVLWPNKWGGWVICPFSRTPLAIRTICQLANVLIKCRMQNKTKKEQEKKENNKIKHKKMNKMRWRRRVAERCLCWLRCGANVSYRLFKISAAELPPVATSYRVAARCSCSCQCWPFALIVARLNAKLTDRQERASVFQIFMRFFPFFIFQIESFRFVSFHFIAIWVDFRNVSCGRWIVSCFLLFELLLCQQKSYVIFHFEMPVA